METTIRRASIADKDAIWNFIKSCIRRLFQAYPSKAMDLAIY